MKNKTLVLIALLTMLSALFYSMDSFAQPIRKKIGGAGVAGGLTTIATGAALLPEPLISKATAGVTGIGQGVTLVGLGLWDLFAAAPANPDPNHAVVASVTPVIFTPMQGSGQPFVAINTTLTSFGQIIDDSRLVNISLSRYFGALADGNSANAEFQRAAASGFFFELESDLTQLKAFLPILSSHLQATSFAPLSTNIVEILAHVDQVVASGFPASEQFVFAEMNATAAEIQMAIEELARVNASELLHTGVTDADLTGASIFNALARELDEVDLRGLLPQNFALAPEPSTLLLFSIGALGLLGYGGQSWRRSGLKITWHAIRQGCAFSN